MSTLLVYLAAGLCEIAGCFSAWAWLRLGHSPLWLIPGGFALGLFALLLTQVEAESAGRAYAAYGGLYIALSLGWLWIVEGRDPDRWDLSGAVICLAGAGLILWGPRAP